MLFFSPLSRGEASSPRRGGSDQSTGVVPRRARWSFAAEKCPQPMKPRCADSGEDGASARGAGAGRSPALGLRVACPRAGRRGLRARGRARRRWSVKPSQPLPWCGTGAAFVRPSAPSSAAARLPRAHGINQPWPGATNPVSREPFEDVLQRRRTSTRAAPEKHSPCLPRAVIGIRPSTTTLTASNGGVERGEDVLRPGVDARAGLAGVRAGTPTAHVRRSNQSPTRAFHEGSRRRSPALTRRTRAMRRRSPRAAGTAS